MNNCYGKNNDMQQRIVTFCPAIGEVFQTLICVPDTDDEEQITSYVNVWVDANMKTKMIDHIMDMDMETTSYDMIGTQVDRNGNEYEIYSFNPTMRIEDYFILHQNVFNITWDDLTPDCQNRLKAFIGVDYWNPAIPVATIEQN